MALTNAQITKLTLVRDVLNAELDVISLVSQKISALLLLNDNLSPDPTNAILIALRTQVEQSIARIDVAIH